MPTTFLRRILFLLTLGPLSAAGQTPAGTATPIDAVSASPDQFKVLLENPQVRVVEYVLLPGERDQWHTHPPKVSYVVSGGTLRITTEDGQSFLADEKTGTAHWAEAVGRHFVQNVGKTPVRVVLVETRSAVASPPIVGTWLLESIVDTLADGSREYWMGSRPTGAIIYSASGHMSVQFMRDPRPVLPEAAAAGEDRARLAGSDPFGALGAAELRDVVRGYYAYFGRYQVSAAGDAITHFVETSLKPNEVGVAYQRAIRIEAGRLFISLQAEENGVSRHRVLTWRRAE